MLKNPCAMTRLLSACIKNANRICITHGELCKSFSEFRFFMRIRNSELKMILNKDEVYRQRVSYNFLKTEE